MESRIPATVIATVPTYVAGAGANHKTPIISEPKRLHPLDLPRYIFILYFRFLGVTQDGVHASAQADSMEDDKEPIASEDLQEKRYVILILAD